MATQKNAALALAISLALTACGGGGGGDTPVQTTSGKAVDGYLSGMTVFCDLNKNSLLDAGEMSTTTDTGGNYRFDTLCAGTLAGVGGIDTATSYAFKGMLKGPADSAVITPLTTLIADTGLSKEQIVTLLGLPPGTDITKQDPMASGNGALLQKTLAVQQVVQQLANQFVTLTYPAANAQLYSTVAASLASALLASPNTPLVTANGTINSTFVDAAIQKTVESVNANPNLPKVSISDADRAAIANAVATQAAQFLDASKDPVEVAKELQNPLNPPVETETVKNNYISPKNDSFQLNGVTYSLANFADGIAVTGLDTIGLEYSATGTPEIDKLVDVGFVVDETSGNRILQVKVEQLHVVRDNATGQVTLTLTPASQVHVYVRDAQGSSFNSTLTDLGFNPLIIENNAMTVNYANLVNRIAQNEQLNTHSFKADQFLSLQGTFDIKVVVSTNLNVRYEGGAALPMVNMGIFNTTKGVEGPGITGRLTIN